MAMTPKNILVSSIHTGGNDRTVFKPQELETLAGSIRKHGLIQPITVNLFSPDPSCVFGGDRLGSMAQYTLIAGERRLRAVKLLGEELISANVIEVSPAEASILMLIENVARVDLDPIDEARAYQIRIEKLGWTIEECAKHTGVSTIKVQFRLKLLSLRDDLQGLIRSGNLSIGYAQILADSNLDPNRQLLATKTLRDNPKPTPGWFRTIVGQYQTQQNQAGLFDTSNFLVCQEMPIESTVTEPAHPSTTTPPVVGRKPLNILRNQIEFWNNAAAAWDLLGKPFKRNECLAASQAVAYAANQFV